MRKSVWKKRRRIILIICAGIFGGITLLTGTGSGGNVFAQRFDENETTASGEARQDDSIQNDRVPDDSARMRMFWVMETRRRNLRRNKGRFL